MKTSVFPREMGRKIGQAEEIRHVSDYDDFYIASKEETERQIAVAGVSRKILYGTASGEKVVGQL